MLSAAEALILAQVLDLLYFQSENQKSKCLRWAWISRLF
jgi:hypothetical protein